MIASRPRFIFFGTDEFAVGVLTTLTARQVMPTLIITTPDAPAGRGRRLTPPVKVWADAHQRDTLQPAKLDEALRAQLAACHCELFLVASYGELIPPTILDLASRGALNIHPSLLPKYRGPSPIQTAILNGDELTGVSLMLLDEEMDHGPVVASGHYLLTGTETFGQLRDALAARGADIFIAYAPRQASGEIEATPQDHMAATYTKKFTKADAELKASDDGHTNFKKFRAFTPTPGAWSVLPNNQTRVRITAAHLSDHDFMIDRLIPAGRREMSWSDYVRGASA